VAGTADQITGGSQGVGWQRHHLGAMTDLPLDHVHSLPGRLGALARVQDGELVLDLEPFAELLHHGVVRASVLSYLVDCVAGIPLDSDPTAWTLTTDMTVRARPIPAPPKVIASFRPLREGKRSATGAVDLRTEQGEAVGTGAIGFTRVPRREGDPVKPDFTVADVVTHFGTAPNVDRPLRDAAGIEVLDAAAGAAQVELSDLLRNPAGTMQGAMVALLAEVAAEELSAARAGGPTFVTDLDLRYLTRTGAGPMRTRTEVVGDGPDAALVVELVDVSTDTVTTLVHARATTLPTD
jgi:acyl-coenzyme A thioesterase PaaI-like protein